MDNEDSALTDSDDDGSKKSNFHFGETYWLEGVHQTTGVLPKQNFLFNQNFEESINIFCSNRTIPKR